MRGDGILKGWVHVGHVDFMLFVWFLFTDANTVSGGMQALMLMDLKKKKLAIIYMELIRVLSLEFQQLLLFSFKIQKCLLFCPDPKKLTKRPDVGS